MGALDLVIHNECGHATAEEFLDGFLGPVVHALASHLGRAPTGPAHVVLSDRLSHERRFPPKPEEVLELEDLTEIPEDERDRAAQRYTWSLYAHGVTTHAAAWQLPPEGVTEGDLCVYLDVESIESISEELQVLFEGMLGRVAAHEFSHAIRGHATEDGRATHGWYREGDAQRDAWHVLTDLLTDPSWEGIARWGRAAQVRLANRQPAAYRFFESDWSERARLANHAPHEPPSAWIMKPPRAVFVVANCGLVEVPVADAARSILGAPSIGDHVYLSDASMVAGPWVVVGATRQSRASHPKDQAAVERYGKELRAKPQILWLRLRQQRGMVAALESDVRSEGGLSARRLKQDELAWLAEKLRTPAAEVVADVARGVVEDHRAGAAEIAQMFIDAGHEVPEGVSAEVDPFDD